MFRLLEALPAVRRLLRTDVEAAYEGDPAARSIEEVILAYPSTEAVAVQRVAHVLYNEGLPVLPRMMTEWAHSRTGIDIHPGARIGSHFFIDHGTGVVIGETARIGNHVKLYDGVTLGARSFPKDAEGRIVKGIKRHPDVEDNVTIYANATILGGETVIGANTTIGASAFLVRSVPPNSLVALEELEHRILDKSKRALKPLEEAGAPARQKPSTPRSGPDRALTARAREWAQRLGLHPLARRVHVVWSGRLTSTAGNAQHESGRISLNPRLHEVAQSQIEQTLLHELAHLIAYERAGRRRIKPHGPEWEKACRDLGIGGEARCHTLPLPRRKSSPRHAYGCPHCGSVVLRVRPMARYSACYSCCRKHNRGRYDDRFRFRRIPLPPEGAPGLL